MNGVVWWLLYIQEIKIKKICILDLLRNIFLIKMHSI
nr:MAG TPA: hypothetical protein [Caudoviricetes sp.]DAY68338.1 MAG TPA: hypothetical protein [Caudoviricetes sp.]